MEIIKCADCKWCKPFKVSDESGETFVIKGCALNHFFEVEDYFFCSDGERKENE